MKQIKSKIKFLLNNEHNRRNWIELQLKNIKEGSSILDAGCGKQQYKIFCDHLNYYAQDFGKYKKDEKDSFAAGKKNYKYGKLDYIGNIWEIDEVDNKFDVILCSEVLEHIPFPYKTLKEFHRLLKPSGRLILTFPSNCLRHQDPYFFSSGYSDRYMEYFLPKIGFEIEQINPIGDYYKWLMVEMYRTAKKEGIVSSFLLLPAFVYFYFKQRSPSIASVNTLCMGYHVLAKKK
ncbi:MAG: class I SAM-dependent methyltransferase [Bacteroidales bacterium]|nr:class I SAM-dependent methyltransferase [Bacteroidales bacterium]